jgi:hypothetical protein
LKNLPPYLDPERETPWDVSPFTDEEAARVQECLRDLDGKGAQGPARTAERWWPLLRRAADICALNLRLEALRSDDPKPMRQMRRSLQRIQKIGVIPKKFKHQDAIEYGARRAGIDSNLSQLTPIELRVAAKSSLTHVPVTDRLPGNTLNILFDDGGRPTLNLFCSRHGYLEILSHIYRRITGKKPGYSTNPYGQSRSGPAVRFFSACLAPFHANPTPEVVVGSLKKLRKKV